MEFVKGDVVELKSGGLRMTVEKIDGDEIHCVWSEGRQVRRETFNVAVLQKYVPAKVGVVRGRSNWVTRY